MELYCRVLANRVGCLRFSFVFPFVCCWFVLVSAGEGNSAWGIRCFTFQISGIHMRPENEMPISAATCVSKGLRILEKNHHLWHDRLIGLAVVMSAHLQIRTRYRPATSLGCSFGIFPSKENISKMKKHLCLRRIK